MARGGKKKAPAGRRRGGPRRGGVRNGGKVTALKTSTVPDRMVLRMKYTDNIILDGNGTGVPGGSPFVARAFRLNSIFDPDTSTVAGHQPLGYDQWNVFYNKYRVYKAGVTIRLANSAANSANAIQAGFFAYNANGAGKVIDDSTFEQPHMKKVTLGGRGGQDRGLINYTVDVPRILGMAPVVYKSVASTSSLFGANPLESINGTVVIRSIDGQSVPLVSATVDIVYYVELFDRMVAPISVPDGKDPDDTTLDTGSATIIGA